MYYKKDMFKGNKITLMGLGLLGRGVGDAEFFAREGAEVLVTDLKNKNELKESLNKLKKYKNIKYRLGKHDLRDFENRDFILKAAGVPLDSPFINHARLKGIPIIMSTALFALLAPAKIVGITGTRGKTTVTNMLFEILKAANKGKKRKVYIGGNVQGVSTLALLPKIKYGDMAVLELDSWQLEGFGDLKISPSVAIFTTFMPDHLNYYKNDLNLYFKDKLNIFKFQKREHIAIAGEQVCSLPTSFTSRFPVHTKFVSERALPKSIKLKIPGTHNIYNAALAYTAAHKMGVSNSHIVNALNRFKGVPGRLEKLGLVNGITIYNDTTSTTPQALTCALEALGGRRKLVLIAGGYDKGISLKELKEPIRKYCKAIHLLSGTGSDRLLKDKTVSKIKTIKHQDLESAVKGSLKDAVKGDVILFSPGFASFGMFKNEYDRGEQFNKIISKMKKSRH
jgi:UDP-N-acetylmuramoylalanine--D-glutamate ligase